MKMFLLLFSLLVFSPLGRKPAHAQVVAQPLVTVTATTTSQQALAANTERRYLLIQNKGATSVLVKFDSAIAASEGIVIIAGGNYESYKAPMNSVHVKASSGTDEVLFYEGK